MPLIVCVLCLRTLAAQNFAWAGGPVIQNARIIPIYWGTPDPSLRTFVDRFYSQLVGNPYIGRLSEFSTGPVIPIPSLFPGFPGPGFRDWFGYPSEQIIGTGTFVPSYVIQSNLSGVVETTDIGPQLDHEIHVGHIPGPDKNTIYMVHFSKDWQLYLGTNFLGKPIGTRLGDFISGSSGPVVCAYHVAYYSDFTDRAIVFGAVPNQGALPNCVGKLSPYDAETVYASHELVEAITDPGSALIEGGFLSVGVTNADQAWRHVNGPLGLDPLEIADQCQGWYQYLQTSGDPRDRYYVSASWSNKLSTCLVSPPIGTLDSIQKDGSGVPHVSGWSLDPEAATEPIQAHIYFDGPYPYGKGYAVAASNPRPDVNTGTGYPGSHGFDFVVPNEFRDGKAHSVYAYGIGLVTGNNALLSNVPLAFNEALANQSASQPVMIASGQNQNQCMDIVGGSAGAGTGIQLYGCAGGANQLFTWHSNTQEIKTYNDSTMCLDAASGAGKDGDRLVIWPCNGGSNQKWQFNLDTGEIRGVNGKCVAANGGGVSNGTAVQIWTCNRGANQTWFRK